MHPRRFAIVPAIIILCAVASLGPPQVARAGLNAIEVTTTDDELNVDGDCSLREAVVAANTNLPVDACTAGVPVTTAGDSDLIQLEPVRYTLAIPGRGEDAAATGDLDLTEAFWIRGVRGGSSIDGAGLDRILDVAAGAAARIVGVELLGGDASAGAGGAIRLRGDCGLLTPQFVAVFDSIVRDSAAVVGGGIYAGPCRQLDVRTSAFVANSATETGGGIAIEGLSGIGFENSTVSGNVAGVAGGGIWASLEVDPQYTSWRWVTIARNTAPVGAGFWYAGNPLQEIRLSIVAENEGPDCFGLTVSFSYNVADDASCLDEFGIVGHASLAPLTTFRPDHQPDLGGNFTFVHPLLPSSNAIDINSDVNCFGIWPTDQTERSRAVDGNSDGVVACDAGAFEAPEGTAPPPVEPPPSSPGPDSELPDTALPRP